MISSPLVVLGLDPGTLTAGYGIVERHPSRLQHVDNGLISASRSLPLHERLDLIYTGVKRVLHVFSPDVVVVESVFAHRNAKAAIHLGHGRGVVLLAAQRAGCDVVTYAPAEIKKTVTGRGRADKLQVQMMVKVLLGLPEPPAEDAADALAMAICHCHHETESTIRDRLATRARR